MIGRSGAVFAYAGGNGQTTLFCCNEKGFLVRNVVWLFSSGEGPDWYQSCGSWRRPGAGAAEPTLVMCIRGCERGCLILPFGTIFEREKEAESAYFFAKDRRARARIFSSYRVGQFLWFYGRLMAGWEFTCCHSLHYGPVNNRDTADVIIFTIAL